MEADSAVGHEAARGAVAALRRRLADRRRPERTPLAAIPGCVAARPVVAPADRPERDRATMDGFALDAAADYPLDLLDAAVGPGDEPPALPDGAAVRVATGASLPGRATAVLRREDATVEDGRLTGPPLDPGANVAPQGRNVREGETLVEAADRLAPRHAALFCDLGLDAVETEPPLSVGILATGSEIHDGSQPDRDSEMLAGLVASWGHEAALAGSVPDDPDRVRDRVAAIAGDDDVVVTTGGTGGGRADYTVRALADLGEVAFRGVRLRPGRPVTAAWLPDHDAVAVALPGKPVAAHAAAVLVARPLFVPDGRAPSLERTLARAVALPDRSSTYAVPVVLDGGDAMPLGHVDSALPLYEERFRPGVLASSTRALCADGFVLADADLRAGDSVRVVPYEVVE